MKFEDIIKLKLNNFNIEVPSTVTQGEVNTNRKKFGLEDACWPGYEAIGLKDDGSPNCVPIKASIVKDGFPIPSPETDEQEDKFISRCISDISDEYDTDQAYAICKGKWDEK